MIMEEEAKVYDEKQIVVYVDAEKKRTNHDDPLTDFIIYLDSLRSSKKCPVSPIAAIDSSWIWQGGMPNEPVMSLPSGTTSFEELAVRDADFGTTKLHDGRLATSTGVAKNCFIVPPLHSKIRAMKPRYLANHHHGMKSTESIISGLTMPSSLLHTARTTRPPAMKSTESIISGLTMPTSLLHAARTTRPPVSIYAETTQL
jgi:hypothetical protein